MKFIKHFKQDWPIITFYAVMAIVNTIVFANSFNDGPWTVFGGLISVVLFFLYCQMAISLALGRRVYCYRFIPMIMVAELLSLPFSVLINSNIYGFTVFGSLQDVFIVALVEFILYSRYCRVRNIVRGENRWI